MFEHKPTAIPPAVHLQTVPKARQLGTSPSLSFSWRQLTHKLLHFSTVILSLLIHWPKPDWIIVGRPDQIFPAPLITTGPFYQNHLPWFRLQ